MNARLREGIRLFNEGQFFECHEIWEGFYHETDEANKPFVEGLIQLAAAFRMFCDFQEVKGPVRMMHQALIRFENYQPAFYGFVQRNSARPSKGGPKPRKNPPIRPLCRRCRKSNCNASAFFMTDIALAQRLEHFLEGTWTGSKRVQGIQGGARALAAGATGGT